MNNDASITGRYLSGKEKILIPKNRRSGNGKYLEIKGAKENNLKNITVKFPLGTFICVTGVSGSGKSSLVNEILYKAVASNLYRTKVKPGKFRSIKGIEHIDKVVEISQAPIGRTPRSNPATYTGVFDDIRDVYTLTKEAKIRVILKEDFLLMLKVEDARHVKVMVLKKLKCTFYQMFMFLVKYVAELVIIEKH